MYQVMIGLGAIVSFLLSGCAVVESSKVDPSAIESSYQAHYDEESGSLRYEAVFQVGNNLGTYVEFDDGSEVKIDSRAMALDVTLFKQATYVSHLERASNEELTKTHVFAYRNAQCQGGACGGTEVFENAFRIPGRVFVPETQDKTASRSSSLLIHWGSTEPLQADERISATIRQATAQGSAHDHSSYAFVPQGSSGSIEISRETMASFAQGPAYVWICRENVTSQIRSPGEGGSLTSSYCSKRLTVNID